MTVLQKAYLCCKHYSIVQPTLCYCLLVSQGVPAGRPICCSLCSCFNCRRCCFQQCYRVLQPALQTVKRCAVQRHCLFGSYMPHCCCWVAAVVGVRQLEASIEAGVDCVDETRGGAAAVQRGAAGPSSGPVRKWQVARASWWQARLKREV